MGVRDGRPGIFLRDLRVPAERRHDEPVLHLRRLPQVTPLHTRAHSRHAQMDTRQEKMNLMTENCFVLWFLSNTDVRHEMEDDLWFALSPSSDYFPSSGSRLGGVVTTMCFFFNHGEVSLES